MRPRNYFTDQEKEDLIQEGQRCLDAFKLICIKRYTVYAHATTYRFNRLRYAIVALPLLVERWNTAS